MAIAKRGWSALGHLRGLPWAARPRRPAKIDVKREARSTEQLFGVSVGKRPKKPLPQRREARESLRDWRPEQNQRERGVWGP